MDSQPKDLLGVVGGSLHGSAVAFAAAALIATAPCAFPQSPHPPSPLSAGGAGPQGPAHAALAEVQQTCAQWAELAGRIMDLRQQGMPEDEAMDHTLGNAFFESLVMGAYEVRQLAQPDRRAEETLEFKHRWYLNCLRGAAGHEQH